MASGDLQLEKKSKLGLERMKLNSSAVEDRLEKCGAWLAETCHLENSEFKT
jgi:hypothetical protein